VTTGAYPGPLGGEPAADGTESRVSSPRRRLHLAAYTDAVVFGGAEQYLAILLESLGSHVDVTVVGHDAGIVDAIAARRAGARTRLVPPVRNKRHIRPIVAHIAAVRRLRPDIFQANLRTPFACQYGILAALVTPGVRTIAVELSPIRSDHPVQRWVKRQFSRRLAAHVSVGEHSARTVESVADLRAGSVRTIYGGVPEVTVVPALRPASGPLVGMVGRLSREKGADVLIRALPELAGVTCVFVGDGPERAFLEQLVVQMGVGQRVIFTGQVADGRASVAGLDVLVVPSRFEGLPLVIVEALAAGVPVVAADVGSVSEAVIDGQTGLLVPPEDPHAIARAVRRLLDDDVLRRLLVDQGRRLAGECFTAAAMAHAFEALYAEVLG
jgi:glycosyltransferase involved in cell wall biosynthesis